MSKPSLIAIKHDVQLAPWPDYSESDIASGTRKNSGKMAFEDKTAGISTGVWEQDANETNWMVYPFHEFMIVLEGAVTIVEETRSTTISAGESFVIPKGLKLRWIQKVRVRKVFVIIEDAAMVTPGQHVIKLDHRAELSPSDPPSAAVLVSSPPPKQGTKEFFGAMNDRLSIGVWETTPYTRRLIDFPRYELMHLLSGYVRMTGDDGAAQRFGPGDTFFVPLGAPNAWESEGTLRKLFCILMPPD